MKKIFLMSAISLLLLLSLIFGLLACGNGKASTQTSENGLEKGDQSTASSNKNETSQTTIPSSDKEKDNKDTPLPTPIKAENLMDGYTVGNIIGLSPDESFASNEWRLAWELFKNSKEASKTDNVLISPLSIQLALAMTLNGADGQTREEMLTLLGGEYSLETLNEYLRFYVNHLPNSEKNKLQIANSIWFKETDFVPNSDFLQTNKTYYDADIYKAPFDQSTAEDINNWANQKTDGMIKKVVDKIDESTIMYLINAIMFDGEWAIKYGDKSVKDGYFTTENGEKQNVKMMGSTEHCYYETANGVGFKKDFINYKYSFVALLPNEGVGVDEYIASLTYEEIMGALNNPDITKTVLAQMPKFSYEFTFEMSDVLKSLGMEKAFDKDTAEFGKIGEAGGNIFIENVLHKTYITVDQAGTRAGAVTSVSLPAGSAPGEPEIVRITLDRPFVYMIIDNETNIPIFIGTLDSVNG